MLDYSSLVDVRFTCVACELFTSKVPCLLHYSYSEIVHDSERSNLTFFTARTAFWLTSAVTRGSVKVHFTWPWYFTRPDLSAYNTGSWCFIPHDPSVWGYAQSFPPWALLNSILWYNCLIEQTFVANASWVKSAETKVSLPISGCQWPRFEAARRPRLPWRKSSDLKSGKAWWWSRPSWTLRPAGSSKATSWCSTTRPRYRPDIR